MVIDLDKCTGCQACVVACAVENNIPIQGPEAEERGLTIQWLHLLPVFEDDNPHARGRLMPMPCQHCDNPPCTKVCPVYATYKNEEGIVAQIYPRCIGCRYCVNACPYTCKFFNWEDPQWPEEMAGATNPDVSRRTIGVTEKCSFCHHRLVQGREKADAEDRLLEEADYRPACVETCPAEAMYFGDLDDEHSAVATQAHSARAFTLLEDLGARPKVIYLNEG
jgi:molybdopterin-containing oxidoreductase family iron-sulfur binding subunit